MRPTATSKGVVAISSFIQCSITSTVLALESPHHEGISIYGRFGLDGPFIGL